MTTQTLGTRAEWLAAAGPGAADFVCLAAAPTFATMALLNGVFDSGGPDMLCAAMHGMAPLYGMTGMYALMSAFHAAPWLRLIAGGRDRRPS
jgi:hypothetical protein